MLSPLLFTSSPSDFQHNSGSFHKYSEDSSTVRHISDGQEEDNSAPMNGFVEEA